MAEDAHKIREALKSLIKSLPPNWRPNYVCKVKSVDWDARTCDVVWDETEDGDEVKGANLEFFDVRLRSINDNETTGVCFKPAVDSYVIIEIVEGIETDTYVTQYSEIEEIEIEIGKTKINIKDGEITINDGNNKGLLKLSPTVGKINALEKDLNRLKTALMIVLNTVINTAAPGAPDAFQAAMKGALSQWGNQSFTLTQESDLENDKVKH